jgi:hypothetical protein
VSALKLGCLPLGHVERYVCVCITMLTKLGEFVVLFQWTLELCNKHAIKWCLCSACEVAFPSPTAKFGEDDNFDVVLYLQSRSSLKFGL